MSRPPLHGAVVPRISTFIVPREMTGGAAGTVAGGIDSSNLGTDVTAGAELAIQLSGEVVQFGHRLGRKRCAIGCKLFFSMGGVAGTILPFPSKLGIADHPGSGVHEVAFYPLKLIAVAGGAAILPAADVFRVTDTVDSLMRFFLPLFQWFAAMAGDTITMGFGSMFKTFVAAGTGGLPPSLLTTSEEGAEQQKRCDADDAERSCRESHSYEYHIFLTNSDFNCIAPIPSILQSMS